jgi:hypothetical protein
VAGLGPRAMAEGYSSSGSQANKVARKPGGTTNGGKRSEPVGGSARVNDAASIRQMSDNRRVDGGMCVKVIG